MGKIYTNLTLTNTDDIAFARANHIGEDEIREIELQALVDTGADFLIINDLIREQLGLETLDTRLGELANGTVERFDLVGSVRIKILGNRMANVDAMVVPGATEILIGAIPLQNLDVHLDMLREEISLPPDRPYLAKMSLKGIRKKE